MARTRRFEPRLFFKDGEDNYYVQTAGMDEPARVPDEKTDEVEEVVSGEDDRAGFVALEQFAVTSPSVERIGRQVITIGACRGACGRDFGVLRQQQVR